MFGFVRKKKILDTMKGIKDANRKENLYAKYPPEDSEQAALNCYASGYEDGTDNFYNALKYVLENK